jgi:hypothetical protein
MDVDRVVDEDKDSDPDKVKISFSINRKKKTKGEIHLAYITITNGSSCC